MSRSVLQRVAEGDASAVDDCLTKYGGLVWSIARRFCVVQADAEDAVQEIFIDVWRTANRFDPEVAAEATFVTMIARRRLIDRQRKQGRQINTRPLEAQPVPASERHEHQVEIAEEAARIRQQLERLRPTERQVLELSINFGLSQSEIAERTKLPLGTVKTNARRGLIRLRKLLGEAAPAGTPKAGYD